MKSPLRSLLTTLVTVVGLLLPCSLASSYPLTLTDDLGQKLTLDAEPMRVVSMLPSHTETLCAIGACDKLVGVDSYSNFPARVKALPQLGNAYAPNLEAIVAAQPDLVLADESSDLAKSLKALGVPVYAGSAQTLRETYKKFHDLGQIVNREEAANALTQRIQQGIEKVRERVADLPPTRFYYEIDATPYSVGPASYIGTLLQLAGGDNIVSASLGDFPKLDPEYVVKENPALIFVRAKDAASLKNRPGWQGIGALKEGRVVTFSAAMDDVISRPGPRILDALHFFAASLHPEQQPTPQPAPPTP